MYVVKATKYTIRFNTSVPLYTQISMEYKEIHPNSIIPASRNHLILLPYFLLYNLYLATIYQRNDISADNITQNTEMVDFRNINGIHT